MTGAGITQTFLGALSRIYGSVISFRNYAYDRGILASFTAPLPVISIGNLTAGGNGKTPITLELTQELARRGWHPVIVSRGYGGTCRGPKRVLETDSAVVVGDEPLMMARRLVAPVVVSRDRVAGANYAADERLGDLVVLDDGLQHRRLRRDVNIVAVNVADDSAVTAFEKGELLPLGFFREERAQGLARTDAVIFGSRGPFPPTSEQLGRIVRLLPLDIPHFTAFFEPQPIVRADGASALVPGEVKAFCGIANPEPFYMTLEAMGYRIRARQSWPDHHSFTRAELMSFRVSEPTGLPLVCTEKDAVRIDDDLLKEICVLRVSARISPLKELADLVEKRLLLLRPEKGKNVTE